MLPSWSCISWSEHSGTWIPMNVENIIYVNFPHTLQLFIVLVVSWVAFSIRYCLKCSLASSGVLWPLHVIQWPAFIFLADW